MTYQKIIVDKLENTSPKGKKIFAWCEIRGRKGDRRVKWIDIEICKVRSVSFHSLYPQCFGCSTWHDYLPEEKPEKKKKKFKFKKIVTKKSKTKKYKKIKRR